MLERPERIAEIKADYEKRLKREEKKKREYVNPLQVNIVDIDDLYGVDEGNGSCNICHK